MRNWRPVPSLPGVEASDDGKVRCVLQGAGRRQGEFLSEGPSSNGYLQTVVTLKGKRKNVSIHRAVCEAFNGPAPKGSHVRHLDGNKKNNSASNLCYGTPKQNAEDKERHGRTARGAVTNNTSVTEDQAREIIALLEQGQTPTLISKRLGVSRNVAYKIKYGVSWQWLKSANERGEARAVR